jgi:hypothetical protein
MFISAMGNFRPRVWIFRTEMHFEVNGLAKASLSNRLQHLRLCVSRACCCHLVKAVGAGLAASIPLTGSV